MQPARLCDVVEQMSRFETYLDTALEDVDARVDQLHATWTGAAADAQRAAHDRWKRGAQEMRAALTVMRQIASTAHANYSGAAEANVSMWGQAR
ncbi:MAG: WXG100 family type VII secretion target [Sciscionella sp.]